VYLAVFVTLHFEPTAICNPCPPIAQHGKAPNDSVKSVLRVTHGWVRPDRYAGRPRGGEACIDALAHDRIEIRWHQRRIR